MKALVMLLVLAGVAHAETRPRYGGTVEASLLGAPTTFDPVAVHTHADATAVGLVFDTLYAVGPDGVARPHLAVAEPVLDASRTTVWIAIRKGVKFQDGTPLAVQDVAASLGRARASIKWLLTGVVKIRSDGDAIELTLRAPIDELATLLALPQTAVTKAGRAPGAKPIGSGPFAIETFDPAHHRLALRAFDEHFAGRPYLDQLVLHWYDTADGEARKFETGAAHVSARGVAAFAGGHPAYRSEDVEGQAALLVFVGFGRMHKELTTDHAFRRAIDLAVGRGGFTAIGSGERVVPTRVPVPVEAGAPVLDAAGRNEDLAAAQAALADAARRVPSLDPAKLSTLKLEILVEDTRPDDHEIAERIVRALDKLGIDATITSVTATALRDRVAAGTCDLWIGQLAEPVTAYLAWWGAAFAAGGDDWPATQLAMGAIDPVAASKVFAERLPIIPLMFRAVRLWYRTDIHGVAFDASGRPCYADLYLFGAAVKT